MLMTLIYFSSLKNLENILNAVEIELKVLIKVFDIHQLPTPVVFFKSELILEGSYKPCKNKNAHRKDIESKNIIHTLLFPNSSIYVWGNIQSKQ